MFLYLACQLHVMSKCLEFRDYESQITH